MGAESMRNRGRVLGPVEKSGAFHWIQAISVTFFSTLLIEYFNILEMKWPKSEGKLNFNGRWFWVL